MALSIAAFTFTSCEDVPEPYNNPYDQIKPSEPEVEIEAKGSGIASDPFNVAAIIKETSSLADGDFYKDGAEVYVTGIVTETTDISAQYGNATYYISDDAKGSNRFYVYRGKLLDGAAVAADTDLQVGDSVTVCGKIKNYKGTMEFDQGNYLSFYKKGEGGSSETPATPGTAEKPLTVAEALAYTNALDADKQSPVGYVKGKICAIKEIDTGNYGNATYSISDDGTEDNALQVYRGYSLNGEKFKSANEIKVGDEVIITGKLVNYKGNTPQFAQGSSIYSLNGGNGDNGNNNSNEIKAITVAEFIAAAESTDVWYKLTGTISNLKDGDQYGNFDLTDATGSVYVYGVLSEKGGAKKKFQELVTQYGLQNGSTITIIGNRGSYNDKIEVLNAYIYAEGGNNGNGNNDGGSDVSLTNGNFETWADGLPTGWKSASTASSATLTQSTDAHGGSYSVNVNGNESQNKRLASQEIELEAGTYTFSFWAKATVSDASQARPGYVPITDGTAGSYSYGDYATLSTSWQQVSYEFTLAAKITICLVVMNPKKSNYSSGKDILIDDATLTKK